MIAAPRGIEYTHLCALIEGRQRQRRGGRRRRVTFARSRKKGSFFSFSLTRNFVDNLHRSNMRVINIITITHNREHIPAWANGLPKSYLLKEREKEREHAKSAKDRRRIVYLRRIISEISLRDGNSILHRLSEVSRRERERGRKRAYKATLTVRQYIVCDYTYRH